MDKDINATEVKKQRERSTAYPSIGLEESLDLVRQLREKLGQGPHKRSAAAVGIGYSGVNGASAAKIAAMTHFGLLERTGDTYSVSDVAKRVLFYKNEEDKMMAIIEAARQPHLYSQLLDKYSGEKLPGMLNNILHIDYGVSSSAAASAAETFLKSMRYAKLLDENGILSGSASGLSTISNTHTPETTENSAPKTTLQNDKKCRVVEGIGWRVTVESEFALSKEIKSSLLDIEESLENLSRDITSS